MMRHDLSGSASVHQQLLDKTIKVGAATYDTLLAANGAALTEPPAAFSDQVVALPSAP
jgi:hypothetical protein